MNVRELKERLSAFPDDCEIDFSSLVFLRLKKNLTKNIVHFEFEGAYSVEGQCDVCDNIGALMLCDSGNYCAECYAELERY